MYLLIHEDGALQTTTELTDDLKKAADEGYIDIVDIRGPNPVQYLENEWHGINNVEEV